MVGILSGFPWYRARNLVWNLPGLLHPSRGQPSGLEHEGPAEQGPPTALCLHGAFRPSLPCLSHDSRLGSPKAETRWGHHSEIADRANPIRPGWR